MKINKIVLNRVEPVKVYTYSIETTVMGITESWEVMVEAPGFNSHKITISNESGTYYSGDANGEYIFRVFETIENHRKSGWMR